MGTRARIGIENADGTITSIYTHWDGYPDHHWPILKECYNNPDKVKALMDLGDLSVLAEEIGETHNFDKAPEGVCNAYVRDRGEVEAVSVTHKAEEWPDYGQEFEYLFTRTGWKWRPTLRMEKYGEDCSWKDTYVPEK